MKKKKIDYSFKAVQSINQEKADFSIEKSAFS